MCIIVAENNQYVTVNEQLFNVLTNIRSEALEFETHEEAQQCIDKDLSGEDRLKVSRIEDIITKIHIDLDENGQAIYADIGSEKGVKLGYCLNLECDYHFNEKDFIGLTEQEAWEFIISKEKDLLKENNILISRVDGYECIGIANIATDKQIEQDIKEKQLYSIEDWCKLDYKDKECRCYSFGEKHKKKIIRYLKSKKREEQIIQWKNCKNRKERNFLKMLCRSVELKVKKYYNIRNKYIDKKDVIEIFARIGRFAWCKERWYDHISKEWFLDGMNWPWDESYAILWVKIKK